MFRMFKTGYDIIRDETMTDKPVQTKEMNKNVKKIKNLKHVACSYFICEFKCQIRNIYYLHKEGWQIKMEKKTDNGLVWSNNTLWMRLWCPTQDTMHTCFHTCFHTLIHMSQPDCRMMQALGNIMHFHLYAGSCNKLRILRCAQYNTTDGPQNNSEKQYIVKN